MDADNGLIKKWVGCDFVLPLLDRSRKEIADIRMIINIAEPNNCILTVSHLERKTSDYFGYNCHQALDEYRRELDEQGLLIGCVGAYINFYVKRIMVRDTRGLSGVLLERGASAYSENLPIVETFMKAEHLDNISSLEEQKKFRFSEMNF